MDNQTYSEKEFGVANSLNFFLKYDRMKADLLNKQITLMILIISLFIKKNKRTYFFFLSVCVGFILHRFMTKIRLCSI